MGEIVHLSRYVHYYKFKKYFFRVSHSICFHLVLFSCWFVLVSDVTRSAYSFGGLNCLFINSETELGNTRCEAVWMWVSHVDWWLFWLFVWLRRTFRGTALSGCHLWRPGAARAWGAPFHCPLSVWPLSPRCFVSVWSPCQVWCLHEITGSPAGLAGRAVMGKDVLLRAGGGRCVGSPVDFPLIHVLFCLTLTLW